MINQKLIVEWTESAVTRELAEKARKELERLQSIPMIDVFIPGEPQKTQENMVELEAKVGVWEEWVAFLEGNWSYFEGYDDGEQIGDITERE